VIIFPNRELFHIDFIFNLDWSSKMEFPEICPTSCTYYDDEKDICFLLAVLSEKNMWCISLTRSVMAFPKWNSASFNLISRHPFTWWNQDWKQLKKSASTSPLKFDDDAYDEWMKKAGDGIRCWFIPREPLNIKIIREALQIFKQTCQN